eukprot:s555_g4.t9
MPPKHRIYTALHGFVLCDVQPLRCPATLAPHAKRRRALSGAWLKSGLGTKFGSEEKKNERVAPRSGRWKKEMGISLDTERARDDRTSRTLRSGLNEGCLGRAIRFDQCILPFWRAQFRFTSISTNQHQTDLRTRWHKVTPNRNDISETWLGRDHLAMNGCGGFPAATNSVTPASAQKQPPKKWSPHALLNYKVSQSVPSRTGDATAHDVRPHVASGEVLPMATPSSQGLRQGPNVDSAAAASPSLADGDSRNPWNPSAMLQRAAAKAAGGANCGAPPDSRGACGVSVPPWRTTPEMKMPPVAGTTHGELPATARPLPNMPMQAQAP